MAIPRPAAILLLLLSAPIGLAGQETNWVLGLAGMPDQSSVRLETAEAASLSALPLRILDRLQDLEVRFLSEDEIRMLAKQGELEKLYASGSESAALRDLRDSAALAPLPAQQRAADKRILSARQEQKEKTPTAAGAAILDGNTRAISLWKGHADGRLISDSRDPAQLCRKEGVDYLIQWKIEALPGYIRIRAEGWNALLRRSDFSHTAYCSRDDILSAAEELASAVILACVSRPSARLRFRVDPPEASIFVDGRRLAPGRTSLRVYEERGYAVSVEAPGRTTVELLARAEFGGDQEYSIQLEPSDPTELVIESRPSGANLYLDGIWAGKTPVGVALLETSRVALITSPGYEDLFVVLNPDKSYPASFQLETAAEGTESVLSRRKDNFYQALGWLVVSLPVSILSYGVYLQSAALHLEYPSDAAFSRRNDISLAFFTVASGITAAFFTNAAIRLARYVKSAR